MVDEKQLTKTLQTLQGFTQSKPQLEQYCTPPGLVAHLISEHLNHILGKTILDLGAGTGMLGIGALLAGAKHVTFIEKDEEAVKILKNNLEKVKFEGTYEIIISDIHYTDTHAETTLMNPPFGTREKHADTQFLDYACTHSNRIISLHKTSTKEHIRQHIDRLQKKILSTEEVKYTLKHTMPHHKKTQEIIAVSVFVIK